MYRYVQFEDEADESCNAHLTNARGMLRRKAALAIRLAAVMVMIVGTLAILFSDMYYYPAYTCRGLDLTNSTTINATDADGAVNEVYVMTYTVDGCVVYDQSTDASRVAKMQKFYDRISTDTTCYGKRKHRINTIVRNCTSMYDFDGYNDFESEMSTDIHLPFSSFTFSKRDAFSLIYVIGLWVIMPAVLALCVTTHMERRMDNQNQNRRPQHGSYRDNDILY